ncbi:MAG: hypothetical protein ACJ8GL_04280 [Bacillus sp. (in: firmicutes)]
MTLKLSYKSKNWLLILHILFAAIMLGNMVVFLIFSITAAASNDKSVIYACYQAMNILSGTSVRASTIGTTVTGVLLSIWTKWGLFKFYWIIVKEGLTLLLIGLNIWAMYAWTLQAVSGINESEELETISFVQAELWTGIIFQIISLLLMYVISVFKPWGKLAGASQ